MKEEKNNYVREALNIVVDLKIDDPNVAGPVKDLIEMTTLAAPLIEARAVEYGNELKQAVDLDDWQKEQILKKVQDQEYGDEMRKQLEVNLDVLQQRLDERHPEHAAPHCQELQKKLDEQFDALRAQLEAKLAADRQMPLEKDKDRSR